MSRSAAGCRITNAGKETPSLNVTGGYRSRRLQIPYRGKSVKGRTPTLYDFGPEYGTISISQAARKIDCTYEALRRRIVVEGEDPKLAIKSVRPYYLPRVRNV